MSKLVIEYNVRIEREIDDDFRDYDLSDGWMLDNTDLVEREQEYFEECVRDVKFEYGGGKWDKTEDVDIYIEKEEEK